MKVDRQTTLDPSFIVRGLLLFLIPLIALSIYIDGQNYDPGLLEFKSKAQSNRTPANFFPKNWGGLQQTGLLRRFDKTNLYEYVNGHAEFFIGAGFLNLTLAEYGLEKKDGEPLVTMEIYHMGKPLHAFGILMDETSKSATPIARGSMGFKSGKDLRFILGPYYIKLSAFTDSIPLEKGAIALERSMRSTMESLKDSELLVFDFPDFGKTISTSFVKENYLGLDFLGNVIERTFHKEGILENFKAFMVVADEEKVAQTHKDLLNFFQKDGINYTETKVEGLSLVTVNDPYEGDWFFVPFGERLIGVFGPTPEEVMMALKRFGDGRQKTQEKK
ncbi:MAG: hypothetical protein HQL71_12005 [Magnetococcales bacterium]|nr:hypothetical protein [Magnetococcales bacterium]